MYLRIEFADQKPNDEYCLNMIKRESERYGFSTLVATIVKED